ncbi:cadherin-like domain-containing protein [Microvirga aerilata]|uniref:Cadherin-like domain-containing protein n=1 Tax=Microvirga aerilata TaxID=670292 RepID=A0A936ZA55_9HYPH|nr:cadherin-like domain-containing protein [Microvirga aerilata]MBL0407448.1 cadherin-like domain-containing protein [Microvirga aerilata]
MPSITFQQGVNGYAGTQDTTLRQSSPNTNLGSAGTLYADSDTPTGTGQDDQVLLQFSALFGSATNQIPLGATITKATLSLQTTNAGDGAALHRMLTGWSEAATWGSLSNGIQANGTEAVAAADRVTGRTAIGVTTLDVTASVQAWAGGAANNGWAFLPSGGDGWDFLSAEGATKPKLTVEYTTSTTPPPTNTAPVAADDSATTNQGTPVTITVLANDTDSNGDTLTVSAITANATHGTTTLNSNGTITYTPTANYLGDDSFTYSISDGRGGSDTATVNLTINAPTTDRPFDESYIATTFPGGRQRVLEHDNATKSFFVDGDWYAVLPDGAKWYVERFNGNIPAAGQQGGWTKASTDNFLDNNRASDIAWDSATEELYVLQYWETSTKPRMFKLDYDPATRTFVQEAEAQIAGAGGKLASTHWGGNKELVIGMDQFGTPLVADVGQATSGANQGIHLAWASKDLSTWAETTIDPVPSAGGTTAKWISSRSHKERRSTSGLPTAPILPALQA